MDDEQILDLYFARDEQALAETDRKYGGYCYSLANGILNSEQDTEETVSDTYLKAWNTIPPTRRFQAVSGENYPQSGLFPMAAEYRGKAGRRGNATGA